MIHSKTNNQFYDFVSNFYDDMISSENALKRKEKLFSNLFDTSQRNAADLGCGSGVDSIALVLNSFSVDAFDPSKGMIEKAEENCKNYKSQIKFHNFAIDTIPAEFNNKYDIAVSLGNTFANIHPTKLYDSFNRIYSILKEGGKCYLQILNYKLIKQTGERIINIKEKEDEFIIRFYDFYPELLKFNILKFSKIHPEERSLITTDVFPHTNDQLEEIAKKANFNKIAFYSDLEMNKFDIGKSKNIVIKLTK